VASDITATFDATVIAIGQTNASYASNLKRYVSAVNWGSLASTEFGHPKPLGGGFVRTGVAVSDPRVITMTITSEWNTTNPERNLLDEANDDLPKIFRPDGDTFDLEIQRTDSGGSTINRILTVEAVEIPATYDASRVNVRGSSYGNIQWDVVLQAAHPFWRDKTATTEALSLTNLDATHTNQIAWTQINNTGAAACGMKWVISGMTNTITSFAISNTSTGDATTWTDAAFANSDWLDFYVDDPQVVDWTPGNTISATSNLQLRRGLNDGNIQGTGSSSPACTATLSYRLFWAGF